MQRARRRSPVHRCRVVEDVVISQHPVVDGFCLPCVGWVVEVRRGDRDRLPWYQRGLADWTPLGGGQRPGLAQRGLAGGGWQLLPAAGAGAHLAELTVGEVA